MAKKIVVLPKGTAAYPYLTRPDTKFGSKKGFKMDHINNTKDVTDLLDELEDFMLEEFGKTKAAKAHRCWKIDEEKGTVTFKTASTYQPSIADIKGNDAPANIKVGGGSTVKTKVTFETYSGEKIGITAYLNAVQVLKLVEFGGGGFGDSSDEVEDGYESTNEGFADESKGEPEKTEPTTKSPKKRTSATEF